MFNSPSTSMTSTPRSRSTPSCSRRPPAKIRDGYANFAIADPPLKLILFADAGEPGTLNHIGVEVDSTDEVAAAIARATADGFDQTVQDNVSCCLRGAGQDVGARA